MILKLVVAILVGILGISTCALAIAPPITLSDLNSSVSINPYSQSGVYNWTVELFDHMGQNSYWYRVGGAGVASPISSLTVDHVEAYAAEATVYYTSANFDMQVMYSLAGASIGSGTSDLSESVMITNKTASTMAFHLFEYVNYDLNATPAGETATHVASTDVTQTDGATSAEVNPTTPNYWEMGDAATLLNKLSSTSFTNLAGTASPYTGDAAFIFQWDESILAHRTNNSISEDMRVSGAPVPEPSCAMVLVGALGLLPALRRRRH